MNPKNVDRARVVRLIDLPNVGKKTAEDLRLLGYLAPGQIVGASPFEMYERLCSITNHRHDPCVIDVFMSITEFLSGNPPRPWCEFTKARKGLFEKAIKK